MKPEEHKALVALVGELAVAQSIIRDICAMDALQVPVMNQYLHAKLAGVSAAINICCRLGMMDGGKHDVICHERLAEMLPEFNLG